MKFPEIMLFGSLKYKGKQAGDIDLCLLDQENWEEQLEALEGLGLAAGKNIDLFIDPGSEVSSVAYFDVKKRTWSFEDRYTMGLDFSGYWATPEEIVSLAKGIHLSLPKANREVAAASRGTTRFGVLSWGSQKEDVVEMVKNQAGWWRVSPKGRLREGPYANLEEAAAICSERGENLAWRVWWQAGLKQEQWLTYPILSPKIRDLAVEFDTVGLKVDREDWANEVRDGGRWQCAQGAVFAAWLADQLGIERELQVGLYWHKDWKALGRSLGQSVAECQEERGLWDEEHGRIPLDEHHHWVRLTDPESGQVWLLDPNGEHRGDTRLAVIDARYEADDYEAKWSGISSQTDVADYMKRNYGQVLDVWQEAYQATAKVL